MGILLIGVALFSVLISTFLLTEFDRYHFKQYLDQNIQLRNEKIVQVLSQAYERNGGSWSPLTGVDLGNYILMQGVQIRLLDDKQQEIWHFADATNLNGDFPVSNEMLPIISRGRTVGYAELAFNEPQSYTELDIHYFRGMTQGLLTAVIVTVIAAVLIGWMISQRITKPLRAMTDMAVKLREGDLNQRISLPKGQDELKILSQTLNHLAAEMQRLEKLRKNLAADVAHELRTPLTTLKSHLLAFIDGIWEPTPERLRDYLEEIERLISLSSGIEALTRTEIERLDLQPSREDLVETTRDAVQLMQISFQKKGVNLSFAGQGPCFAIIDRDKWKQIIINLLVNALKYTPTGGTVLVKVRQEFREGNRKADVKPEWIQVSVADTGIGIPPEHLPYIFERFYRVDASRTRSTGGAGIGLTIVKNLVQAHGGTIFVDSEPRKGTSFSIRIPAAE